MVKPGFGVGLGGLGLRDWGFNKFGRVRVWRKGILPADARPARKDRVVS